MVTLITHYRAFTLAIVNRRPCFQRPASATYQSG
jgi:hypothetical protein